MELPRVASKLDGAIGLSLVSAEDGVATLRLDPSEIAVVVEEDREYLHGGTLATCVDTASWYAATSAREADWLVTSLDLEAMRMAVGEPHRIIARCIRAGRNRAVVDVEISPQSDPGRLLAVGRVSLAPASGR